MDLRLLRNAALAMVVLIGLGALGFHTLGGQQWSWFDSLYMAVTTIVTVGYGEVHDLSGHPWARLFATLFILVSFLVVAIFTASLTAAVLEGRLSNTLRRRKNMKAVAALSGHQIVSGLGETGIAAVRELLATGQKFVAIDPDESKVEHALHQAGDFPHVVGDPTLEEVLDQAGIRRAAGLLVAGNDDRVNVFLVITARGINPDLRIVARAVDPQTATKLRRAGATSVVAPNELGGMRLASEMLRPRTTSFLDRLLYHGGGDTRMNEAVVPKGSRWDGRRLSEIDILTAAGVVPLAIHTGDDEFLLNPPPHHVVRAGQTLIVVGSASQLERLRDHLSAD
jgi:voltage-gated potassium channel